MPPEQSPPWDRKEFFRERKHERSETLGGSAARWRDLPHHPSRDLNRWGSSDLRRPVGHGKQNGWHFFPEESHHGYSRDRVMEDENFRPFPRGEGRYNRNNNNNRDNNRGSYNSNNQREWRGHSWETNSGFSNTPIRTHEVVDELKPREEAPPYQPHPNNNGFGQTWDQIRPREQHNNNDKTNAEDATGLSDWKPIKCPRSGSLSSRGTVLTHLGGSKSVVATDLSERKVELETTRNESPVRSPSVDANNASAMCATGLLEEESGSRKKKPRLGWGEGLAKYEKKKVDGPEVTTSSKDGAVSGSGNVESLNLLGSSLADYKSPKGSSFSDCVASPATPSSVACSSSPGLEDKSFGKLANTDHDTSNLCVSPEPVSQDHSEVSFNLENLDCNSVAVSAVLSELQSDDRNTMASSFMSITAMNKLLILKGNISKNLEVIESEIDQLETELKLLNSALRGSSPSASSSLPPEDNAKSCNEQGVVPNPIPRPAPLQVVSSGEAVPEKLPICNGGQEENFTSHKDVDVDSPGTVTSKLVEPLSLEKAVSSASGDSKGSLVTSMEVRDAGHGSGVGKIGPFALRDDNIISSVGEKTASVSSAVVLFPGDEKSHDVLFSTNKEVAARSREVFNMLLPRREYKLKTVSIDKVSLSPSNLSVKERFAMRKRFSKFKLRVITLKFKAFQYLWKEDMRLLSIRKHRAKSQKKFELSLRSLHNGYQKHRSSIRSRFSSPAGSISLVPTTEVINFTSKMMSDSQVKLYRDTLKMPALIIDKKEKASLRFPSNNGLVEDPCAAEKGRAAVNPWTPAEREIFMEKFALFGKDFKTIATFLDQKTTADCVEFYYKNHKSDCFEKKKKLEEKSFSTSNYLMTSGQKWNRERSAASLDILGTASMIAANADNSNSRSRQGYSRRLILGGSSESRASWVGDAPAERSGSFGMAGNDREAAAADVLAGISLSSEAMSSCITSSADPGESYHRQWKSRRIGSVFRPDVTQNVDEETCSDESYGELMDSNDWTDEEKSVFVQAVSSYGKDFSKISRCVRTRSRDQCKVFFSKARKCLGLDQIRPVPGSNERKTVKDDTNGSGSGSEKACAREVGSGVVQRTDEDLPISSVKVEQEESKPAESVHSQPELKVKIEANLIEANCKNAVSGGSEPEPRPNAVSDGDSNIVNGIDDHSEIVPVNESESSLAELVSSREGNDDAERPESGSTVGASVKPVDEEDLPDGFSKKMNELEEENGNLIPTTSGQSGSTMNFAGSNGSSCSGPSLNGDHHQNRPVSLELSSKETNSVSVDSGPTPSEEKGTEDKLSSSSDSGHATALKDESQVILTSLPLLNNSESSSSQVVPRSFQPSRCNRSLLSPDTPFTSQAYYLQKCSGLRPPPPQCSVVSQNVERAVENLRSSRSQSLSDSENSCRSGGGGGDVKLFGKILSNPSSTVQKPDPLLKQEKEGGLKFLDGNSGVIRFEPGSYAGFESVQMRSYGYRDRNRIPAAVGNFAATAPASARLLATYPAAFGTFAPTTPASKIDQQQTVLKTVAGERGVNGVVFPGRDISGEGYQLFRGGGSVVVSPVLGSFQHHTGMGVSDPVAALKLSYAKEQFGGPGNGGGVMREGRET